MSDRWNEALEAAADKLRVRACGYLARYDVIYNGRIVSEELFGLAEAILALREADPVHPSAKPFKCPHCGSHCFGPTWRGKELAGRYCKGWPSDEDRSYRQCPAKYVEWYGQADQRGAQQVSTDPLNATADPQSAPHHPGGQEKADGKVEGDGKPAPASPGLCGKSDNGYCLVCGGSPPMTGGCWRGLTLAAAEEERSRG